MQVYGKVHNLKLKIKNNKSYHQKRTATGTPASLICCLNHCSSVSSTSLLSGLQTPFTLDPFCSNALIILVPSCRILWLAQFTRPNSRHTSAIFIPLSVCRIKATFPSTLQTFLLFATVTLLSRYQSAVNCSSTNAQGNFTHTVNYRHYWHCRAWNLCSDLKAYIACPFKDEETVEFSTKRSS